VIYSANFQHSDLGVQIISDTREHKFDYGIVDPMKLVLEELVPVAIIDKMV
jgi:catalase